MIHMNELTFGNEWDLFFNEICQVFSLLQHIKFILNILQLFLSESILLAFNEKQRRRLLNGTLKIKVSAITAPLLLCNCLSFTPVRPCYTGSQKRCFSRKQSLEASSSSY